MEATAKLEKMVREAIAQMGLDTLASPVPAAPLAIVPWQAVYKTDPLSVHTRVDSPTARLLQGYPQMPVPSMYTSAEGNVFALRVKSKTGVAAGGYGEVRKVWLQPLAGGGREPMALKRVLPRVKETARKGRRGKKSGTTSLAVEACVLDRLRGVRGVRQVRFIVRDDVGRGFPLLLMDWHDKGTMSGLERRGMLERWPLNGTNDEDLVATAKGLVQALASMHAAGVAHNDLKPSNILINDEGDFLIADAGSASRLTETILLRTIACTSGYEAPERMKTLQKRAWKRPKNMFQGRPGVWDSYSLGVCLLLMLLRCPRLGTLVTIGVTDYDKKQEKYPKWDEWRGAAEHLSTRAKEVDTALRKLVNERSTPATQPLVREMWRLLTREHEHRPLPQQVDF
jgi:serine/threonine protein kinase